jgi:hypothetical protein
MSTVGLAAGRLSQCGELVHTQPAREVIAGLCLGASGRASSVADTW